MKLHLHVTQGLALQQGFQIVTSSHLMRDAIESEIQGFKFFVKSPSADQLVICISSDDKLLSENLGVHFNLCKVSFIR